MGELGWVAIGAGGVIALWLIGWVVQFIRHGLTTLEDVRSTVQGRWSGNQSLYETLCRIPAGVELYELIDRVEKLEQSDD